MNPLQWFEQLHSTILSARAKVGGREATLADGLKAAGEELVSARERQASVWWVGNGGSSALCAHLSQDLLNKLSLRSMAMADAALLTCMANDFGYPEVYARPLRTLIRPGDLLIAISSSGRSANILNAVQAAAERQLRVITLSAFKDDNPLWKHPAAVSFYVDCSLYGHAEVGHGALLHSVIETLWLKERGGQR